MSNYQCLTEPSFFGESLRVYTRAQAIADGSLVDVSGMARDAGFPWPVAMTHAAWRDCVAWSETDNAVQITQDEPGRLGDVLTMAMVEVRRQRRAGHELRFELFRVARDGSTTAAVTTALKLLTGPGDAGEPVVTILLLDED